VRRHTIPFALLLTTALLASGCAGSSVAVVPQSAATTGDPLRGSLTVSAAASLGTAFDEIAAEFEAEHPGVDVRPISYDGSSTLATQILEGAPVDVFASADEGNMQKVVDADLAEAPRLFASNTLVIAVPLGNPARIGTLADLAEPDADVVLCASEVPCGAASAMLLDAAGVTVAPASVEQNVTAVLTKVAAGEADAGLVYATDARAEDAVEAIVPEGADAVVNRYPIAALRDAADPEVAAAFVAFVAGERGRAILADLGFGAA
jgi:molybdate transport system substrate-binding protein